MEDEKRVVIVIPVYRYPVAYESISLTQCVKVLGRYPIVLVTPESMDIHPPIIILKVRITTANYCCQRRFIGDFNLMSIFSFINRTHLSFQIA